jgi:ArsR family transcriptional regulator
MTLTPSTTSSASIETLARQLKVLAEPNRLRIFNLLMEGVQCNCELGDALAMAPNLISHHLRILREIGLVDIERDALDARWVYYSINATALATLAQIQSRHPACGPQRAFVPMNEIVTAGA